MPEAVMTFLVIAGTVLALAQTPAPTKAEQFQDAARKGASGKEDALESAVQENSVELVKAILDSGGIPPAKLTDALEAAKNAKKADLVAMLEQAGAKPAEEFKIDPALLAKYAGVYKGP